MLCSFLSHPESASWNIYEKTAAPRPFPSFTLRTCDEWNTLSHRPASRTLSSLLQALFLSFDGIFFFSAGTLDRTPPPPSGIGRLDCVTGGFFFSLARLFFFWVIGQVLPLLPAGHHPFPFPLADFKFPAVFFTV